MGYCQSCLGKNLRRDFYNVQREIGGFMREYSKDFAKKWINEVNFVNMKKVIK